MRSQDEIQRAHDILTSILAGDVVNPFEGLANATIAMIAGADVLCWILEHEHNDNFAKNLAVIKQFMAVNDLHLAKGPALPKVDKPSQN